MSVRKQRRYVRALVGSVVGLVAVATLAGCGGTPTPAASPSPSTVPSATTSPGRSGTPTPTSAPTPTPTPRPTTKPSTQEPVGDQVEIDITIAGGKVDPSGKKIDVPLGATVLLDVTSDADDEIHAHVGGGDGYSLEVKPGTPAQGRFTVTESGSFEIESHELGKIIAILNVR